MAKKRKERKKIFSMPLHKRRKLLHAHLSKELKQKYKKRALAIKKGYKVKIMRGAFKGKEGNVIKVSYKKARIYIEGITKHDARGKEKLIPIHPSNVMILSIS
ncbi:MAG: 50S ribosomal protein L24 [Candidatus Anstonellales archaeon]